MDTYLARVQSEIIAREAPISLGTRAFFQERLRIRLHALVLQEFKRQEAEDGINLTRAELARRIDKKPAQITYWLNAPSNMTLDTLSDLLLGMGGEPGLSASLFVEMEQAAQPTLAAIPTKAPPQASEVLNVFDVAPGKRKGVVRQLPQSQSAPELSDLAERIAACG